MTRYGSMILLLATISLAGCEKPKAPTPGVYDIPVAEAFQRLYASDLADMVYAKQCGILVHVTPEGITNRYVTWHVASSGQEVVRFTALLTPLGDRQTKVEIKMPADPKGGEVYDGEKFYNRPAFNQPLKPAVEEQVSALLEGRKFDVQRVGPGRDSVCNVQRGGLESGIRFRVDDKPGEPH
ncbi:MAG: hypothetical protein JWP35_1084 [Caulobacter sp.]|nr:hypothetical protein [Caulobacter sp.]